MNKKTIFISLGIVAFVVLVAIGIVLKQPTTAPVEGPPGPAQTETEIPAETPAEESAETPAETPPETPPAETPKLSSCVLLDEEYCSKGEPLYWHGSLVTPPQYTGEPVYEGQLVSIGFNLPEGTKIYAPFDGLVGIGGSKLGRIVFIDLPPLENTKRFFIKDVESAIPEKEFTAMEGLGARKEVKKGEPIAIVRGNIIDITRYGSEYSDKEYTVVISGDKGNAFRMSSFSPDSNLLRQYFSSLE